MQGERRALYSQRLSRDLAELLSNDSSCSASALVCTTDNNFERSFKKEGYVKVVDLSVKVYEGPYRGGCYNFQLDIPESYPFKAVDVWARHPIWHPNIDLQTGRVILPIDWCPVLTLNSLALAVQMIMLEPSIENPTNIEAYRYFVSDRITFDYAAQKTLHGCCVIAGVSFSSVLYTAECLPPSCQASVQSNSMDVSEGDSPNDQIGDGPMKRSRSESLSSPLEETATFARPLNSSVLLPNRPTPYPPSSPTKRRRASPLPYFTEEMSMRVTKACSLLSLDNQSLG